jgi:glucokinase
LERDAIGITLAEQYFGHGHDLKNFATIYIGTGIGAGFVFNGEIFYGEHDHAGEFGHGIIDKDSRYQCRCQNFGCLECFASGLSLINRCKYDIKRGGTGSMLSSKVEDLYYNDILAAANEGDEVALKAFKEFADELAIGLSNLINYLDLEKVIIGGPLSRASKHYLDIVQEIVTKNIIFSEADRKWSKENIVVTKLDDEAIEIAGCVASFIEQHPECKVRKLQ